jgi:hypothetical protein
MILRDGVGAIHNSMLLADEPKLHSFQPKAGDRHGLQGAFRCQDSSSFHRSRSRRATKRDDTTAIVNGDVYLTWSLHLNLPVRSVARTALGFVMHRFPSVYTLG